MPGTVYCIAYMGYGLRAIDWFDFFWSSGCFSLLELNFLVPSDWNTLVIPYLYLIIACSVLRVDIWLTGKVRVD